MAETVEVVAPMPGLVASVSVKPGDAVAAGDTVIVLQAMKMEFPVGAEEAGTVSSVDVAEGQEVDIGTALVTLSVR